MRVLLVILTHFVTRSGGRTYQATFGGQGLVEAVIVYL